jgi:hypothetical protein
MHKQVDISDSGCHIDEMIRKIESDGGRVYLIHHRINVSVRIVSQRLGHHQTIA